MENAETVQIRLLAGSDPPSIAAAFTNMGRNKPETRYRRYLHEQVVGTRTCFVGIIDGQFVGYVTVNWRPTYPGFADLNIPEIQDLNVLTKYRRKGIASRLLDRAETEVARRSGVIGIGSDGIPGTTPLSGSMRSEAISQMVAALRTEIALWKRAQA
jgi:GNAT superfamily N-acetyltransferase